MSTSSKTVGNPFPGLRPFETEEYRLFFGREGQSDELLARLERSRFLAVVGTSGSGKSSLIRAGLMPALRGGMMKGAGAGWRIAVIRPGGDPIGNLAAELVKKDVLLEAGVGLPEHEEEAAIEATLRSSSLGIVNIVRQARLRDHEKLLVVVDQFEELFRFRAAQGGTSADEAAAFVKLLLEASQQREQAIYIVLTMRSDFLGDCSQFQGLPEAINDGQYLIPRMTRDERRFAVTGPVGVTRGKITEPLVNRLLNDVGDNPDQLPILQHALMRTWDHWQTSRRNGEPIGVEHYEAIGTMSEALSRHADEAFNELPDERSRDIAEILFKALSERGADNREIRRPTRLGTICKIANASIEKVTGVIDVFRSGGRSFLMPPVGVTLHAESVIDISHESLIRNWERLKTWVDEEAQSARSYRRLAEAAVLHRKDEEALLQSPALELAVEWQKRWSPTKAWAERYHPEFDVAIAYLNESIQKTEEAKIAAEAARAEHERQREELLERERRDRERAEHFAKEQARANRKLRVMMVALVVILIFALATAGYAFVKRSQALTLRDAAVKQEAYIGSLLKSEQIEKQRARDAESQAKIDRQTAIDAQGVAKHQADLADGRLKDAVKAQQQARNELIAKNNEIKIDNLNRNAQAQFARGDFAEAETAFNHLTTVFRGDSKRLAWAKSNLGAVRREMGKLDASISDLSEARQIQPKEDSKYFDTVTWLGLAHSDKGQYDLAEPLFLEALKIRRGASTFEQLARNYRNKGQPDMAEQNYNEALNLRRQNPYSPNLTATLKEVGEFYLINGEYDAALKLYKEALSNQELLEPDDPNIAATFNELARVYQAGGFVKRADRLNEMAQLIRLSRAGRDTNAVLMELAWMYVQDRQFHRSGPLITKVAKFVEQKDPDSRSTVDQLIRFGDFRMSTAELWPDQNSRGQWYVEAQDWYQKALEISRKQGFTNEVVESLDGLAAAHLKQKNFSEAERLYKQTLEFREKNPQVGIVPQHPLIKNLEGLAASAVGLGKFADAEAHLLRAIKVIDSMSELSVNMLKISRGTEAHLLRHSLSARLAEFYSSQNRLTEADELYKPLAEKLKTIPSTSLGYEENALNYLRIVQTAGKFYTQQKNIAAAESFYKLVWPENVRPVVRTIPQWPEDNYAKSILALAPDSCVEQMIEILNAYGELLKNAPPSRDPNIEFGILRLQERIQ